MFEKKIFEELEGRKEVLKHLTAHMYECFGEMQGILESIEFLEYLKKDFDSKK